jgi:hypothetical protein
MSAKKNPITYWDSAEAERRSELSRPKFIAKPQHVGHTYALVRTLTSLVQVLLTTLVVLRVFSIL